MEESTCRMTCKLLMGKNDRVRGIPMALMKQAGVVLGGDVHGQTYLLYLLTWATCIRTLNNIEQYGVNIAHLGHAGNR
jgi:hypothetical protein